MFIATIAASILATTTPVAIETPVAPPAKIEAAPANPRVCFVQRITGSMIPLRTCKRLQEWRAEGIDPFAKH